MIESNPILTTKSRLAILLFIVLFMCIFLTIFYFAVFVRPAPPLLSYSATSTQKLCEIFRVSSQDVFCSSSIHQNAVTFEEMLNRIYPVRMSRFDDVMAGLNVIEGNPSYQELIESGDFVLGFCPSVEQRVEDFSCTILFSEEIEPTRIYFDGPSNNVIEYIVQRSQRS